ncbi:hypothetical protein [Burkholderia sp. A9]|uniref:hypothetical protein n=1 Tax=Burkholderia sp. A9 TaxID=1365108 RepID=UPI001269A9C6|nr:hypothetical protein [Burkholderia sp. A9]
MTTHPRRCGRSSTAGYRCRSSGLTDSISKVSPGAWRMRGNVDGVRDYLPGPLEGVTSFRRTTDSSAGIATTTSTTCGIAAACGRAPNTDRMFHGILILPRSEWTSALSCTACGIDSVLERARQFWTGSLYSVFDPAGCPARDRHYRSMRLAGLHHFRNPLSFFGSTGIKSISLTKIANGLYPSIFRNGLSKLQTAAIYLSNIVKITANFADIKKNLLLNRAPPKGAIPIPLHCLI